MIHTWTLAAAVLPPTRQATWQSACEQLGLSGADFENRLQGLDQYPDGIQEMLEGITAEHGL